jgi:hypothetical protein
LITRPPHASQPGSGKSAPTASLHQVVLPDVFAVAPRAISPAQLASLVKLRYVRSVIAVDGGSVRIGGRAVSIIGVNPAGFRSWTPPQTSAQQGTWSALSGGGLVSTAAAAKKLRLHAGRSYRVLAATQPDLRFGGTAVIGIPGVDAVVSARTSRQLGLVRQIGVLISAPGANLSKLDALVRGVLGKQSRFVSLRPAPAAAAAVQPGQLPVDPRASGSRPASYLQLYRDSAAQYCHGLSWTVLAAIGTIESGNGANVGPSSAGALGPMQFLPSTWSRWGIDAFGQTGPPDIMNPFDAVPAAAGYLCAMGAGQGGASLSAAIFGYNHASWYVTEVLTLARQYAREYG